MSNLSIKAVEMVRSIRDAHYEIIKDFTPEEQAAFFLEEARELHAELGIPDEIKASESRGYSRASR